MLAQNLRIISELALITAELGGNKEDLGDIMVGKVKRAKVVIIMMDHTKMVITMMDHWVTSISQPNSAEEITLAPKKLKLV